MVHRSLLDANVCKGILSKDYYDEEDYDLVKEKGISDLNEDIFIFARLLQFLYYGTYSFKADDMISGDANITRPGFTGPSPAMIVCSGFTDFDAVTYAAAKSKDDTTTADFGYMIDLSLYDLADFYYIRGLKEHSLKKYSSFPFEQLRGFYYSVADRWPRFPLTNTRYPDVIVFRAVVPHIANFLKEARTAEQKSHRQEAREILRWVSGVDDFRDKNSLKSLLNAFLSEDAEDQAAWDICCDAEDCRRCRRPDVAE